MKKTIRENQINKSHLNWYPGHMAKAMREVEERMKVIDIIIEVIDSRAPVSSKNPFLENLTFKKKRMLVLTKKDLCDKDRIQPFIGEYKQKGYTIVLADLNNPQDIKSIIETAKELGEDYQEKYIRRGMKPQPLRVMILGIPNVGKSTLINRIVKRNVASARNTPGHTKAQQWIRINNQFDLLDTPGIMPPHFENHDIALHLSYLGSIKEIILPLDEIADSLIGFLKREYPSQFYTHFDILPVDSHEEILEAIGRKRQLLTKGNVVDMDAVKRLILKEMRNGQICQVVVDDVNI